MINSSLYASSWHKIRNLNKTIIAWLDFSWIFLDFDGASFYLKIENISSKFEFSCSCMNGENSGLFITFWVKWLLHFRMVCDNACCIKIKNILKLCVKSGNDGTGTPRWSHSGWDFKKQGKRVHWTSTGHETQFSSKFGAKLSLHCPFFSWTPSTNHCGSYVYCNYKCSRASCI